LRKQVAHKHFPPPVPNHVPAAKRFVRLLEKLRKRAKRLAIGEIGREPCNCLVAEWQRYVIWLRFWALGCICGKPLFPSAILKLRKAILDEVVRIEERELRVDGYPVPDQETLRTWGRKILHNVRRGREGSMGPRSLIQSPSGATAIRFYVRRQMIKAGQERIHEPEE
jgi:hypothetical protein